MKNLKLFFTLYYRPLSTMSEIIDTGSWRFGALSVAFISVLFYYVIADPLYKNYEAVPVPMPKVAINDEGEPYDVESYYPVTKRQPLPLVGNGAWWLISFSRFSTFATLFTLALIYLPTTILLAILLEHLGSFGVVLRRDYGPLLACTLMAWSAAHLPFTLAGLALSQLDTPTTNLFWCWVATKLFFAFLMCWALRTVFGASFYKIPLIIIIASLSITLESVLLWVTSPFLAIWLYSYLRSDFSDIGSTYRGRQSFRRSLEAATVNPLDAEAHYQLGLIYQQRRQYSEAIARFQQAVKIDPREIDAQFQLGQLLREKGQLSEAISCFDTVVSQDDKHSNHEIWREIGITYFSAGMFEDAHMALERYIERRPYDPAGLYYLAITMHKLQNSSATRELLQRCIESVNTAPYYRRGQIRKWRKQAQEQLRTLGK